MRIKYAIIASIILVATVTSVKAFKESTSLFEANMEALAQFEDPVPVNCYQYPDKVCKDLYITLDGYFMQIPFPNMLKSGVLVC